MTTPRAIERAARARREHAARELATMEARARRAVAFPLVALAVLAPCFGVYAVTQVSWAAAASAIAIVMMVRGLLGIPRARADLRPYRERFEQAHAEHEAAFSRFFAAEQDGTADIEPSPPTPPTARCPACGGFVPVAHVQVRSADGVLSYAATEADQDALRKHSVLCPRQ